MSDQILDQVYHSAQLLWATYLQVGPGNLSADSMATLERNLRRLEESIASAQGDDRLLDALETTKRLEPLLRRCVERPEGLSFVTGEAGLVPRHDLHQACEDCLSQLRSLRDG